MGLRNEWLKIRCEIGGKNMGSKKGVSLIVLAITVIVMIILASAVVLSLKDGMDVIGESKTSVDATDKLTVQTAVNTLLTKMMYNTKEPVSFKDGGVLEDGTLTFCVTNDSSKMITKKKINGVEQFAIAEESDTPYTLKAEDLGISAERLKDFMVDTNGIVSLVVSNPE